MNGHQLTLTQTIGALSPIFRLSSWRKKFIEIASIKATLKEELTQAMEIFKKASPRMLFSR
jgi:hypothetical protein